MTEQGPESSVDPITQRLNVAMVGFNDALTDSIYDGRTVTGAFAGVEVAVNEAAEAGVRSPLDVFGALKELSDAVAETAEAHEDAVTAKIFAARSKSYAATVKLLTQPTPALPAAAPAAKNRGRSRRSDTRQQKVSGSKT